MPGAGRDRLCGRCEHVVRDLTEYTAVELEAILDTNEKVCVRALVSSAGQLQLKSPIGRQVARGVSVGVIALTSLAMSETPTTGTIIGTVSNSHGSDKAIATGPDSMEHGGRVRRDGTYRIRHLLPGSYSIGLRSGCEDKEISVTVVAGNSVEASPLEDGCVVVGMIQREDNKTS